MHQVQRARVSYCAHTQLSSSDGSLHRLISRQNSSSCQLYNAGLDYNLRPASRPAIWGTLITWAVPCDRMGCYQEGVTHSGGRVYRRKEGTASGARGRACKLGGRPESVGAPSPRSRIVAATPEQGKTPGNFQAVSACAHPYTHSLTCTTPTHSHSLSKLSVGEKRPPLAARSRAAGRAPRGCVRDPRAREALTWKKGRGGAGTEASGAI